MTQVCAVRIAQHIKGLVSRKLVPVGSGENLTFWFIAYQDFCILLRNSVDMYYAAE